MESDDWKGNKTSYITCSGFHNLSDHDRQQHDLYATHPTATKLLLELEDFAEVWEPAAGLNHMANVLKDAGILSRASDKYDYGTGNEVFDFLSDENTAWDGDIITNPPYKYASEFCWKALDILKEDRKLALFLPDRYLSSKSRRVLFDKCPPYKVWISSSRKGCECAINGNFDKSKSSAVDYCWMIWHKGFNGETKLGWFN